MNIPFILTGQAFGVALIGFGGFVTSGSVIFLIMGIAFCHVAYSHFEQALGDNK